MTNQDQEAEKNLQAPILQNLDETDAKAAAAKEALVKKSETICVIVVVLIGGLLVVLYPILFPYLIYPQDNPDVDSVVRLLNKPPLQTFQTEYGDTFDCVDIYTQPAFDHPLLQNHTIQMGPNTISDGTDERAGLLGINCPNESVPIRRVKTEDILAARAFKRSRFDRSAIHHAGLWANIGKYYGSVATFNSWTPKVTEANQYTTSLIDVFNDLSPHHMNSVIAGWMVYPELFSDSHPRMFAYWTADSDRETGCLNIYCSGFIQIGKLPLGLPLPSISIYGDEGHQYDTPIHVFRDPVTYNWWLRANDQNIGYWPSEVVTRLANEGASQMYWGGYVGMPDGLWHSDGLEMGSGHCPLEGYAKAAYIRDIKYVLEDSSPGTLVDVPGDAVSVSLAYLTDFRVSRQHYSQKWGTSFFYGGRQGVFCGIL